MKRPLFFALITLLGLLAGCSQVQPPPSEPPDLGSDVVDVKTQGNRYRFKGQGASTYLTASEECGYTDVDLFAVEGLEKSGQGRGDTVAVAYMYLFSYDWCNDDYVSGFGIADLDTDDLQISGRLESASLKTTFWLEDDSGGGFEVVADVNWTADGPLRRRKVGDQFREPGYKFKYRFDGRWRQAVTSATLTFEGTSHTLNGWGESFKSQEGWMESVQANKLPPVIELFAAEPYVIEQGQSATLSWVISGAKRPALTIDQGIGDVTGLTSVTVSPTTTTTYTLTATNRNGSSTADVTVSVADALEPNDRPGAATVIDLDYHSPELTITPGDVDWFTFSVSAPATTPVIADIDASALGSTLDSVLGLFDAGLNQLAVNDDSDSLDSLLELSLEPGTYYLAVSGFADFDFNGDHAQLGYYYLSVTTAP